MKIGFTGTRHGLTEPQWTALWHLLGELNGGFEFHHGDCVGADAAAAAMARQRGYHVAAHPPTDWRLRAVTPSHEYREAKPFLERNRDIVDETELLIGCPAEPTEQRRGGTWHTIRYARRLGRRVVVINPDGTIHRTDAAA